MALPACTHASACTPNRIFAARLMLGPLKKMLPTMLVVFQKMQMSINW